MENQEDINELADAIYRDRVLRARGRTMDERMLDGMECFDFSCRMMADGVRHQLGLTNETEVWMKVRERLDIVRRLDERGIYKSIAIA
jgi:hypothetical protein